MRLADTGHLLSPGQRGALTIGEERCLAPCRHGEQSTWRFPVLDGIGSVHVDAEGTAVDLRSTQLDQFDQRLFQR
ncbi:hypothetical protein D3C86_2172140 [compost metagenome]